MHRFAIYVHNFRWPLKRCKFNPLDAGLILTSLFVDCVGCPGGVESPRVDHLNQVFISVHHHLLSLTKHPFTHLFNASALYLPPSAAQFLGSADPVIPSFSPPPILRSSSYWLLYGGSGISSRGCQHQHIHIATATKHYNLLCYPSSVSSSIILCLAMPGDIEPNLAPRPLKFVCLICTAKAPGYAPTVACPASRHLCLKIRLCDHRRTP